MLSAVGQDKITQKAIELGAEYYVVKPFDIELLITRIRELINFKPVQWNNFISRESGFQKNQYIELSNNKTKLDKYNYCYNKSFTLKDISKNNYHFNYELTKNGNTIIFDGDKYKNKQEFIKNGDYPEYYYSDDNNYYLRNNSTLKY